MRMRPALAGLLVLVACRTAETQTTSLSSSDGWFVVNDGVAGGHSDGHLTCEGDALQFSVTRDGGFSAAQTERRQICRA